MHRKYYIAYKHQRRVFYLNGMRIYGTQSVKFTWSPILPTNKFAMDNRALAEELLKDLFKTLHDDGRYQVVGRSHYWTPAGDSEGRLI